MAAGDYGLRLLDYGVLGTLWCGLMYKKESEQGGTREKGRLWIQPVLEMAISGRCLRHRA